MRSSTCLAMAALATALSMNGTADAVNVARIAQAPGGTSCQLSIPTVDTAVRPKATGFRNEGTTGAFAICGIDNPARLGVKSAVIAFYSIDNIAHAFNCTAVNGWPDSGNFVYSTKSVTPTSSSYRTTLAFTPTDFGGADTYMPHEGFISITCSLPPNVSVGYMYMTYDEDVGS